MTTSTPAAKGSKVVEIVKEVLVDIATLQRPVTATAVAAFVLSVTGAIGIDATTLAGILAGVGTLDAAVEKVL